MVLRKIVRIDEDKCNGCGACIPKCVEGALKITNGKARLASEKYCDGLGACLGNCPQGAITVEEREGEEFDKEAVEKFLKNEDISRDIHTSKTETISSKTITEEKSLDKPSAESTLRQWPVQLMLVPIGASFLEDSDFLITADCVPFSYANFHADYLRGKVVLVGCPKFDDINYYKDKLKSIFQQHKIRSITVVNMEVPCCFSLYRLVKEAIMLSGKSIPLKQETITIKGKRLVP